MKTVMAIEKREDVSPEEGKSKYGDVKYADPVNKKYPLDSEKHVRAAYAYLSMPKNAAKYSAADVKTMMGRIKAAGKKYGIEYEEDGDKDKGDKTESSLVYAALGIDLDGETPSEIVFMPKGDEITITPKVGGQPKKVQVNVNADVAELLQDNLAKRLSEPVRPVAGFDHKDGPASFFPKEFRWDEERGVILEVDWTAAGKEAVEGRNYSYFSPTFYLSGKTVKGLPGSGEIGSMTNNPAFRVPTMKIAASAADEEIDETMANAIAEKLFELDVITAEQASEADEAFVIKAITGIHEALALAHAANAQVSRENRELQAKVADIQKAEATTIVQAAVAEGKIPAKDQAAIDFWTAQLTASPETAKKVLAGMPVNPLLQRVIDVKVKDGKKVAAGQSEAELVQAQHLAVAEIRAANPNMNYQDAFNKAKREHPEVFPVEA